MTQPLVIATVTAVEDSSHVGSKQGASVGTASQQPQGAARLAAMPPPAVECQQLISHPREAQDCAQAQGETRSTAQIPPSCAYLLGLPVPMITPVKVQSEEREAEMGKFDTNNY